MAVWVDIPVGDEDTGGPQVAVWSAPLFGQAPQFKPLLIPACTRHWCMRAPLSATNANPRVQASCRLCSLAHTPPQNRFYPSARQLYSIAIFPQLRAFRNEAEAFSSSSSSSLADGPPPTFSLQNLRDDEVAFVRATAAVWRLGHAAEDGGGGGKGVRIWLPPVRLNSTHDVAAGMSVAPENATGDGAGDDEEGEGGGERGDDGFDAGEFRCRVCYVVLPSGSLTVESDVSMPEYWPVIPRYVAVWRARMGSRRMYLISTVDAKRSAYFTGIVSGTFASE